MHTGPLHMPCDPDDGDTRDDGSEPIPCGPDDSASDDLTAWERYELRSWELAHGGDPVADRCGS